MYFLTLIKVSVFLILSSPSSKFISFRKIMVLIFKIVYAIFSSKILQFVAKTATLIANFLKKVQLEILE